MDVCGVTVDMFFRLPKGNTSETAEVECGGLCAESFESPYDGAVGDASPALNLGYFRPFHPHTLSQLLLRESDFLPSLFDGLSNAIFLHSCSHLRVKSVSFRSADLANVFDEHFFVCLNLHFLLVFYNSCL